MIVIEENDLRLLISDEINKAISPILAKITDLGDNTFLSVYDLTQTPYFLSRFKQSKLRDIGLPFIYRGKRQIYYNKASLEKFIIKSNSI